MSVRQQAAEPRGPMGVVMGWFLERGNAMQNRATIEALDPAPGAAVLEIGFGPGHALEMLSRKAPLGLIAGADHSELMVETARRRLEPRRGPAALDLRVAEAQALPFPDEAFDLVYAVNSYHQWPDKEAALAEIAGVLKPGGELLLSIRDFRAEGQFEPAGEGEATARAAEPILESLGFEVETTGVLHSPKRATYLVRGRRP
ncbi:MAG: methyltransferase domain-containing protein [Phenylobacterium sp.]|nr:MAG: methyltransferase domain-containing protein [Phenylobacterium sp.]